MNAATEKFLIECRKLDTEGMLAKLAALFERNQELEAINSSNIRVQTQMSCDYQKLASELGKLKLENADLNKKLAHLAEQNLLKTKEVFGSSSENIARITKNSYDNIPDIDGHEITEGSEEAESRGATIISIAGEFRKNSEKEKGKKKQAADYSKLQQINKYSLDIDAMDKKYGVGGWYVMSWSKKWTLEKTRPVCYIKNVYMPTIVPYDDCRTPVNEGRIPMLLRKSPASASLVSDAIYDKYGLAIPIYRQVLELHRNGVPLSAQTLTAWINRFSSEYFGPVYDWLKKLMQDIPYQQCDETTLQILRDGRGPSAKSYLWVHITSELYSAHKIVLFCFELTRSAEHLKKFYGEFSGFLTCDAYSAYRNFEKDSEVTLCGCFMHARRRFVEAFLVLHLNDMSEEQINGHPSVKALLKILDIYRTDEPLKKFSADDRLAYRQSDVKPLVDEYFDYLRSLDPDNPEYSAKMKDAIKYSINQEQYLRRFLEDGNIPIDNGATERAIRPAAVGRRNYLFFTSVYGAESGAMIYSLIETARANGANARYYLQYLLEKMPLYIERTDRDFIEDMLPWAEAYKEYERQEMENDLHLNLESEEEPPRRTYTTEKRLVS